MTPHLGFLLSIGLLGIASAIEPRISVFAGLLLVIGFASLSRFRHPAKKSVVQLLVLASCATTVGMVRFVGGEALQGITEARGRATSKKAVSLLREILFAQDALRRYAMIDHDGDGVGSAGLLAELSGAAGARGKRPLGTPPLSPRFAPRTLSGVGPINEQEGYLLLICLPRQGGGWATHHAARIDEEAAERRWLAYAWPAREGLGHSTAYFINEHEEIFESPNETADGLRLVGSESPPSCEDALGNARQDVWHVWNEKSRRTRLPGDRNP